MIPGVISLPLLFNAIWETAASDKFWIHMSHVQVTMIGFGALTQDTEETGVASPDGA